MLPDSLKFLLSPQAYPHPVRAVELIETHISWVLLTGEVAYKVKRPVVLPFVDLRSRQHRQFLCHEEVRLNRRFAPELYLGVCRITAGERGAALEGAGPVIEYAVKMRQFDRREALDVLLESQRIAPPQLGTFGRVLAQIHAGLPDTPPDPAWGRPQTVRATILANLLQTVNAASGSVDTNTLQTLRPALEQRLQAAEQWMIERRIAGKVRECHGDLHCSNLVRGPDGLLAFDCLEFEPAFRWIDVADEVAFLLADLESRNHPAHQQAFLGGYLEQSGDYHACRFLDVYRAHRSLVRAKIALLSAAGSTDALAAIRARERYDNHVRCAHARLGPKQPLLIMMAGLSGSGKSWLATRLAPAFGAVHVRSDVERKRLAGLPAETPTAAHPGAGLYSTENSERLYGHLLACAESILAGGYTAIIDAAFGRRADRSQFAELGRRLGITTCLLKCEAPLDVLRARITERARRGGDPSEADLAVLDWQRQHHQAVQADEPIQVFTVSTQDPAALEQAKSHLAAMAHAASFTGTGSSRQPSRQS